MRPLSVVFVCLTAAVIAVVGLAWVSETAVGIAMDVPMTKLEMKLRNWK